MLDLGEELVGGDAQAEHRQPEHRVVLQRHGVVAQRVRHDLLGEGVLDAVDLDDDTPVLPEDVEVVAPVGTTTYDLARGLRQTSDTGASGESLRGRVNLLNWDGNGSPPGLFPKRTDAAKRTDDAEDGP